MADPRLVFFDSRSSAFQELLNTSRTVLTLSSVVLVALVGFVGAVRSLPDHQSLIIPYIPITCLAVTIMFCVAVLLRGINAIFDDNADISDRFYRISYVIILASFLTGFFASGRYVFSV